MKANSAFQKKLNSNLQMRAEKKIKIFFLFSPSMVTIRSFVSMHSHSITPSLQFLLLLLSALNFLCSGA